MKCFPLKNNFYLDLLEQNLSKWLCCLSLLLLSGCSSFISNSTKATRFSYYYYSLKYQKENTDTPQKWPIRLGVYPATGDLEFDSKIIHYRIGNEPDKIARYKSTYDQHRWEAKPIFLLDELLQMYLPEQVEHYVPYPTIADVDYTLRLHLKHFEEFQSQPESKAVVEIGYQLFDNDGTLLHYGVVRKEKVYPTDPGQLNNMVNSLSSCTQNCMQQILKEIADELELKKNA